MNDARQSLRLVRPRATAQGKLPPPPPPSILPVYEQFKASGLTAVFREFQKQQEEHNRRMAAWFAQQQQGDATTTPTTPPDTGGTPVTGPTLEEIQALIRASTAYFVPTSRRVDTDGSLEGGGDLSRNRTLQLVNDEDNPGPNKTYSTGVLGEKGWFPKEEGSRYTHSQGSPSAVWTVNHNLGFRPLVAVEDLSGQSVLADIRNVGNGFSAVEIHLGAPMAGLAFLG